MKKITRENAIEILLDIAAKKEFGLSNLEGYVSLESLKSAGGKCITDSFELSMCSDAEIEYRYPTVTLNTPAIVSATLRIYRLLKELTDDQLEIVINRFNNNASELIVVDGNDVLVLTKQEVTQAAKDKVNIIDLHNYQDGLSGVDEEDEFHLTFTSESRSDANKNPRCTDEITCYFLWYRHELGKKVSYQDLDKLGRVN